MFLFSKRQPQPNIPPPVTRWGEMRGRKRWPEAIFKKGYHSQPLYSAFGNIKQYAEHVVNTLKELEKNGRVLPHPAPTKILIVDFFTINGDIRTDTPYANVLIDQQLKLTNYYITHKDDTTFRQDSNGLKTSIELTDQVIDRLAYLLEN